ncbi:flavin-containing monooxygenase [Leucobacter chinensis]|uniref:flavin-containing monooxygenase n=1 Tax=Leucobacter chinensis TaxID=2851010 RepID=UPI001C23B062
MTDFRYATVVVIGAGQAGLSAGFHLQRAGFASALDGAGAGAGSADIRSFVMLDANPAAGGAWQHRWESLRVRTLNAIFDLPRMSKPDMNPDEPSSTAVSRYFAEFEAANELPIERPVRVSEVRRAGAEAGTAEAGTAGGGYVVETDAGTWHAEYLINATGTWNNPVQPEYPGADTFLGLQQHTRDYVRLEDFAGLRTAVVGGGISALQQLEEISRVTDVLWYTRRPPEWMDTEFDTQAGREVIQRVTSDVEAGRVTGSVVSYTGLPANGLYVRAAKARGVLKRRPMFVAIEPHGVREADGTFTSLDAIVWATGFKGDLAHLEGLGLRTSAGGITMRGTEVLGEPALHLIGFGPSQSTVGANRAGRDAVRAIERQLAGPLPATIA